MAPPSNKTTRLEDLALQAGVSVSTASRALNDSPAVNLRTKQMIWRLARELDYPFRRHMPAGPVGAQATISVVVPVPQSRGQRLSDPFFFELLSGIGEAARERDVDIHISHFAPAGIDDLKNAMTTHRADGVVFVGQSALHNDFNDLAAHEGRFVVWGAELPDQDYCCVGSDNLVGGRRATKHLARLGRTKILFMGKTEAPEAMQRFKGYRDGLEQSKMDHDPDLFIPCLWQIESAEASIDALVSRGQRFDGIVAASDIIALGAIRALARHGISVPDDVSVVGYDNVAFSHFSTPTLTTIDQDVANAGRLILAKLLDNQSSQTSPSERLATELIIRQSCGA